NGRALVPSTRPCPPFIVFSSFPFHAPGDPPLLHSFPTRRSSDLFQPFSDDRFRLSTGSAIHPIRVHVSGVDKVEAGVGESIQDRSEEHTSELQSRENLVCRLLLEKKKRRQSRLRSATSDRFHVLV